MAASHLVICWDEVTIFLKLRFQRVLRKEIPDREEGEKVMKEEWKKGRSNSSSTQKNSKVHSHGQTVLGPKNSWLLIKHADEFVQKDYDANNYDFSAVQGSLLMK